jgi:hypothetical protein
VQTLRRVPEEEVVEKLLLQLPDECRDTGLIYLSVFLLEFFAH